MNIASFNARGSNDRKNSSFYKHSILEFNHDGGWMTAYRAKRDREKAIRLRCCEFHSELDRPKNGTTSNWSAFL